jgi:hypothetical protein
VSPEDKPNTTTRPVIRRDLELEWALMERLNPDFAGRVKTPVDVYLAGEGGSASG